jgi:Protein of unknown function (DUF4235)
MAHDSDTAVDGPIARDEDPDIGKAGYKVLAALGAAASAAVARKVLTASWKRATGKEPPTRPERLDVGWAEALTWAIASAAAMAAAKVVAQRRVAATWQRASGGPPPGVDDDAR